uniref:Uncharacterized protein n=1 Tax=Chromera velia CCMP2878 TaxID=1169474 RepID=A0A0G4FYV2_9ALVE|eukprot:Cvel_19447.t1-p1 / transcript=Cvel_19447.t1 / gene=Cvel_19447 / organism=Chromera_velia_CCMP2878 / gene_product=hypothetical protein / transcript_product=hypothetical protein / location=Cvel_scaffold1677:31686-35386(-) / protein_length=666 / sequence_SO=supercontig / SO=protein_coding / is_pseudo=false
MDDFFSPYLLSPEELCEWYFKKEKVPELQQHQRAEGGRHTCSAGGALVTDGTAIGENNSCHSGAEKEFACVEEYADRCPEAIADSPPRGSPGAEAPVALLPRPQTVATGGALQPKSLEVDLGSLRHGNGNGRGGKGGNGSVVSSVHRRPASVASSMMQAGLGQWQKHQQQQQKQQQGQKGGTAGRGGGAPSVCPIGDGEGSVFDMDSASVVCWKLAEKEKGSKGGKKKEKETNRPDDEGIDLGVYPANLSHLEGDTPKHILHPLQSNHAPPSLKTLTAGGGDHTVNARLGPASEKQTKIPAFSTSAQHRLTLLPPLEIPPGQEEHGGPMGGMQNNSTERDRANESTRAAIFLEGSQPHVELGGDGEQSVERSARRTYDSVMRTSARGGGRRPNTTHADGSAERAVAERMRRHREQQHHYLLNPSAKFQQYQQQSVDPFAFNGHRAYLKGRHPPYGVAYWSHPVGLSVGVPPGLHHKERNRDMVARMEGVQRESRRNFFEEAQRKKEMEMKAANGEEKTYDTPPMPVPAFPWLEGVKGATHGWGQAEARVPFVSAYGQEFREPFHGSPTQREEAYRRIGETRFAKPRQTAPEIPKLNESQGQGQAGAGDAKHKLLMSVPPPAGAVHHPHMMPLVGGDGGVAACLQEEGRAGSPSPPLGCQDADLGIN